MDEQKTKTTTKRGLVPSITLLHDYISEEHGLQTFNTREDEEVCQRPLSPRLRSQSVFEGNRRSFGLTGQFLDTNLGSNDSIDEASNYDSLPKFYRRSNRHVGRLNTQLLLAVKNCNTLEVQRLLEAGASPNATCHTEYFSACHIAALHNNDILSLLLQNGAEKFRTDRLGRTPLHLAAWSGNVRHIAALLDFPEEFLKNLENGEMTTEKEEEVMKYSHTSYLKDRVDVRCDLGDLNIVVPKTWRDNIDHSCHDIDLPFLQPGWTPLHAAACSARHTCCRLLLAAGAEPCVRDLIGRTPLDVAGSAYHYAQQSKHLLIKGRPLGPALMNIGFTEVVKLLLTKSCKRESFKKNIMLDTPLHTAVELGSFEGIKLLLEARMSARTLNRAGLTPLHLCVKKGLKQHLEALVYCDPDKDEMRKSNIVNAKDKDGYTVLHYAVLNNWLPGVCVALEAQALIFVPANDGETSLHTAAALGNHDILKEILYCAKSSKIIDVLNPKGETALFKAISNGHTDCVKMLLQGGASVESTLPRQQNVFHIAAELGQIDILKVLLDFNYTFTREKVNAVDERRGYGPIHFAVENNHIECVKLMLSKNAFVSLKTAGGFHVGSTPLHIAASNNFLEIAKFIIKFDPSTTSNVDSLSWTPLHTAAYFASRDVIRLLIREGANLAACTAGPHKYNKTAIEIITNNLSKPTEFLESIFDMYIHTYKHRNELYLQDPDTKVTVDYSILVPKDPVTHKPDKMLTVIEALLKTGNRSGQRRLLIHPLVESFLCLKWKALLPFFYATLFLNGLFVTTLTIFIMSEYFYKDSDTVKPFGMDTTFWMYALYAIIAVIMLQEIIHFSLSFKRYVVQLETWVKLTSVLLAIILPKVMAEYPLHPIDNVDLPRHVATVVVLLCWLDMTLLLSRFPSWGYYVLMFGKVSTNVLKILVTFAFLVVGFALSFMIQFHHQTPFESPWAALIKTMVMMTSEFDYDDLIKGSDTNTDGTKKDSNNTLQSLVVIRLIFLIFLILAAIVLMNLMVGVAVNDLHNLELLGHIMRLEKQVEFLASLETLVLRKVFIKLLPAKWKYNLKLSSGLTQIVLKPCEPSWSYYKAIPAPVRDAIFEKAIAQTKHEDHQTGYETLKKQLGEIHETVMRVEECPTKPVIDRLPSQRCIPKRLTDTDMIVVRMKRQMNELNAKVDVMMQLLIQQKARDN